MAKDKYESTYKQDYEKKLKARERAKQWRINYPERHQDNQLRWRAANKERKAISDRHWYELNIEKKKTYDKIYNKDNRDKKYLQNKKWAEENREKSRAIKKKYSDSNRLKWRLYCHNRRNNTKEKIIIELIKNWDTKICGICNKPIEDKFHIDHIIPISRGGKHNAKNLQLSHPTCNLRKNNKLPQELVLQGVI